MQKHTWISCLCVPIILSGTHRMINAHQYWFSSSPFQSIPFIYPTKLCLSLSEWKRHRDSERVGNSGNSAHWALMYRKGFKTIWLKRHHSPHQSHFLSSLPVYTCCPRWAGWPIFSLDNNTSTNHRENWGQEPPILLVIHRNTDCRGESSASPSLEEKAAVGPVKNISTPIPLVWMLRNLFLSFLSMEMF